jgi:hypothetical protein
LIVIVLLLLLSLGVHAHFFIMPPMLSTGDDGVLSILLRRFFSHTPAWALIWIYHALVLLQAIQLNLLLNNFKMLQSNAFTTAMAYILFTGFFPEWSVLSPALLANSLVMLVFTMLTRLYNHGSPKSLLFNTGLLISLAVMAYHPTAIMVLVVLFALAVVRPFRPAEWVVLLMGVFLPYYFMAAYLFLTNQLSLIKDYLPGIGFYLDVVQGADIWYWSAVGIFSLILLNGFYYWQWQNARMVIQIRKSWSVLMVMLLLLLPVPLIFIGADIHAAILLLVPAAAFASCGFLYPKRLLIPNLLFWLAVVIIVHNNWVLVKN